MRSRPKQRPPSPILTRRAGSRAGRSGRAEIKDLVRDRRREREVDIRRDPDANVLNPRPVLGNGPGRRVEPVFAAGAAPFGTRAKAGIRENTGEEAPPVFKFHEPWLK